MTFDLITISIVGTLLIFAAYTSFKFLGRFPTRTIDDVAPFLRPAEACEFEALLDPAQELNLRFRLSQPDFEAWQRKRFHLLLEYLLRMSHNALVLIEWGNMEAAEAEVRDSAQDRQKRQQAQELVQAATEFRLYAMLALIKLRCWLLLPPAISSLTCSPSLSRLRTLFGINALTAYSRLKDAAGLLSLSHSNAFREDLLARL
jgi:hypothetical protein